MIKNTLYHKVDRYDAENNAFIYTNQLMNDYTYLNDSGELVTSNQEIREYFRYNNNAVFIGGHPFSYMVLTRKNHDALECVQEYHDELDKYEDSEYWYHDEEDPDNSYNTFLDQFCVIEPMTLKDIIKKLKEWNK